jgi:hypothetical protein
MKRVAGERWDGRPEAAQDIVKRQEGSPAELDEAFSACGEAVLRGRPGPIGASAVLVL